MVVWHKSKSKRQVGGIGLRQMPPFCVCAYSIGLSPRKKTRTQLGGDAFVLDDGGLVHLRQVIYDSEEPVNLLDKLLEGIADVIVQHGPSMRWEEFREKVLFLGPCCKDLPWHQTDPAAFEEPGDLFWF